MAPAVGEYTRRRRLVTAGSAVLLAGAAFGILQVFEQEIGAWHPKTSVSIWIASLVALLGALVTGLRGRRSANSEREARKAHLSELLGTWPTPLVRDANPWRLGVLPARRSIAADAPYVAREIDRTLREATVAGAVVLICGEQRAGASRTLFEAARSALGDAVVLAPRSADALRELTALEDPLWLGDRHAVVWLDGLDRYVEVLDAECLAGLQAVADRVTVLTTIRREHWEEWLGASGAAGEAVRAVLAHARVFELSAELTVGEIETARRLYPGVDFSVGIGVALGSTGHESAPPPAQAPERGTEEEPGRTLALWRDLLVSVPLLGSCIALVALLLYFGPLGWRTISIAERVTAIEHDGSRDARHVQIAMQVKLHSDVNSWLFVFTADRDARNPRSAEIAIYDEHGASLEPTMRFEANGPQAVFSLRAITDVDFDGSDEIVGGYGYANESDGDRAMVPFAIDWNRGRGRYEMISLTQRPPTFAYASPIKQEKQYLPVYEKTTTFSDRANGLSISGYRVQDFTVTAKLNRLVVGWFLRPHINHDEATFELHTAILDRSTGAPHLTRCKFTGLTGPLVVRIGTASELPKAFEEAYERVAKDRPCQPLYGREEDY